MKKRVVTFGLSLVGPIAMIILLTMPIGPLTGGLGILQPVGGIFDVGVGLDNKISETILLHGLEGEVTILVDEWGIPHIYADSVNDAFMGLV